MMTRLEKTAFGLVRAGLLLFLFGLLLGFVLTVMRGSHPMLSAHEAALGSGTFLMAAGIVWRLWIRSPSPWIAAGLSLSHYLLTIGLALSGLPLADLGIPRAAAGIAAAAVILVASVMMTVLTVAALWKLESARRHTGAPGPEVPV